VLQKGTYQREARSQGMTSGTSAASRQVIRPCPLHCRAVWRGPHRLLWLRQK